MGVRFESRLTAGHACQSTEKFANTIWKIAVGVSRRAVPVRTHLALRTNSNPGRAAGQASRPMARRGDLWSVLNGARREPRQARARDGDVFATGLLGHADSLRQGTTPAHLGQFDQHWKI